MVRDDAGRKRSQDRELLIYAMTQYYLGIINGRIMYKLVRTEQS